MSHLQVALIRVEDVRLLLVVCPHHLHTQTVDGRLKIRLLSVDHDSHVALYTVLYNTDNQRLTHTTRYRQRFSVIITPKNRQKSKLIRLSHLHNSVDAMEHVLHLLLLLV
jgi:hypothetical protein